MNENTFLSSDFQCSTFTFCLEGKNKIDANLLSSTLKEFADLVQAFAKAKDPSGFLKVDLHVTAFNQGSFEISFETIQGIVSFVADSFTVLSAVIASFFAIKKFAKNRKPSKIEPIPNEPDQVSIIFPDGTSVQAPTGSEIIFHSKDVDLHVSTISALTEQHSKGRAGFSIAHNGKTDYYAPEDVKAMSIPAPYYDNDTSEEVSSCRMTLAIKAPLLIGNAKWSLKIGSHSISASIKDKQWLDSFRNREFSLHSGDCIDALLETRIPRNEQGQLLSNKAVYSVLKVYGITAATSFEQSYLPLI